MYALLSGVALIGASLALVYRFFPREGAEVHRPGWMDASIVIAAMAGLSRRWIADQHNHQPAERGRLSAMNWLIGAVEMIGGSASMGAGVFLTWLCRGGPPDVAHIVTIPIVVLLLLIVGLSLVIRGSGIL